MYWGLIMACLSGPVFASENNCHSEKDINCVIENIRNREQDLETFSATFVQTKKTYLLREPLQSEGLIYFDRAGSISIKVNQPTSMSILIKNEQMQIYYADSSRFEKRDIGNPVEFIRKHLGIGAPIDALKKQYEFQMISETNGVLLRLKPKQKALANRIDVIEMTIDPKTWLPERIHLVGAKGDYTTMTLCFTSINEPLHPGIFSIRLPLTYPVIPHGKKGETEMPKPSPMERPSADG